MENLSSLFETSRFLSVNYHGLRNLGMTSPLGRKTHMSLHQCNRMRCGAERVMGKVFIKLREGNSEHESGEHLSWVLKGV